MEITARKLKRCGYTERRRGSAPVCSGENVGHDLAEDRKWAAVAEVLSWLRAEDRRITLAKPKKPARENLKWIAIAVQRDAYYCTIVRRENKVRVITGGVEQIGLESHAKAHTALSSLENVRG
jgi:hypothetical protein